MSSLREIRGPMITTSSLVLDGPHGLGPAGPHHLNFVEPYLRTKMPPAEFLRPLPKPAPIVPRYNGRPPPSQSPRKELHPPASSGGPVNLAKDGESAYAYSSRLYPPPGFYPPYGGLYAAPYSSMLRPTYINPALASIEAQYQPTQQSNPAFRPSAAYSPHSPQQQQQQPQQHQSIPVSKPVPPPPVPITVAAPRAEKRPFKVPPGREPKVKTLPLRGKRSTNHNNNTLPPNFTKGSLIQLGNGELRRVEDVTTEDLVSSAERCGAFRLDPSTVVRIGESASGFVLLTLSHGENKRTVEIESTVEHPYYIYGRGWASCSPKRTLTCYGLNCKQLQVGDVCISLSPRIPPAEASQPPQRAPASTPETQNIESHERAKRRRWSAPDQIDVDEEIIDPGSPSPVLKRIIE